MKNTVNTVDAPTYKAAYVATSNPSADIENAVINEAIEILDGRLKRGGVHCTSSEEVSKFLRLKLQQKEREVFAVIFLNSQHQMIEYDEMFKGTINAASVYPREIAKKALQVNAAAIIIAHNHPSGIPTPSEADKRITAAIKKSIALFDINLLDHVIVGGGDTFSFAEKGMI